MKKRLITIFSIGILILTTADAFAVWTEIGDSGALPGTAQIIWGSGPLTSITGTFPDNYDADIYKIYISDPAGFSALAHSLIVGGDTQLFLFDAGGLGIYANDDQDEYSFDSYLPPGHTYSPTTVGIYYLAVSDHDLDPSNASGLIFPNTSPWENVYGPTGPGGGSPISQWEGDGYPDDYTITLTGVQYVTPSPGAILLGGIGVVLVGWLRRRRTL